MILSMFFSATAPKAEAQGDSPPEIISITSSQSLVDRKQDYAGSGATLSTTITMRIRDNDGRENMTGAMITIRDNATGTTVENVDVWASRVAVDENTWDVSYTYNPDDNLADGQLGQFDILGYVADNCQRYNLIDGFENLWSYSEADGAGAFAPSLSGDWKVEGAYANLITVSVDATLDNYGMFFSDYDFTGTSKLSFNYRYERQNGTIGTPVKVEMFIGDNLIYSKSYTDVSNENVAVENDVSYTGMQTIKFRVTRISGSAYGWVKTYFDNLQMYGGAVQRWELSKFTVDDRYSSISFDPASPHVGWELTVSGTHSRYVGSSSVTGSWLIDNCHGQFSLGASSSYSYSYTISSASFGDNVSVAIRSVDGVLDGISSSSYLVNDNIQFQVWVRFEDNYGLVGWIPDENRPTDLLFEWSGGTHPYTLTSNPENITVPSGGTSINIVKLTDNDDYWRYIVPSYSGGNLNFVIVNDISDVEQYRFYLQDYTGRYIPPNGQLLIRSWIGTNLAEINSDYWGADWRTTAWLITGTQYQIWVRGTDAPLRLVGPIDAVGPSEEKTIVVQIVSENVAPIFDYVYWNAWRESDSIIRVEYQDNLDNTIEAHVAINDENGTMQVEYQPDNEWFIITWLGADENESYEVVLTVQHGEYGDFIMTMPIGTLGGPPGVEGGVSEPWGLPAGLTIAGIGSAIFVVIVGLSFDALRVRMGMLAMAFASIFCWLMGFLLLPGPWNGVYTATLIVVVAVLFALTWRRGR